MTNSHRTSDPIVKAQHDETGRMWEGPRSQIPPRYFEVRPSKQMNFGDYCRIEQKRYVGPNEMYQYKVIGRLSSNCWVDVPVDARVANGRETRHDRMEEVIAAICCGVSEREVLRFRAVDCRPDETTARISQRAQSDEECCGVRSPSSFVCTLVKGHSGQHEAYGHKIIESWPTETSAPQAPIARMMVADGFVTWTHLKAPGLPDGMHDVFCEPEVIAPYLGMRHTLQEIRDHSTDTWARGLARESVGPRLCTHGMPADENVCGPCSRGEPNRRPGSPEEPRETTERLCGCIPLTPRPWKYCQDCGGQILAHQRQPFTSSPEEPRETSAVIDTCDHGHRFAKLPDHPMRDGLPRCPHCLAIGFDRMRAEEPKQPHLNPAEYGPQVVDCPCGVCAQYRKQFRDQGTPLEDYWTPERRAAVKASEKCLAAGCNNPGGSDGGALCKEHFDKLSPNLRGEEKAPVCTCDSPAAGPCPAHT